MIAQPQAAVTICSPVLPFELADRPVAAPLATVADILGRDVDSDALNIEWVSESVSARYSSLVQTNLFEEGWQDILGVDDDDEIPANRDLYFAAYVWLVDVANRWEKWIGDGSMDHERPYDLDWIGWHRDLIKDTFQYFSTEWDFPRAIGDRCDGIAHRAIEWTVDDPEFQAVSALAGVAA